MAESFCPRIVERFSSQPVWTPISLVIWPRWHQQSPHSKLDAEVRCPGDGKIYGNMPTSLCLDVLALGRFNLRWRNQAVPSFPPCNYSPLYTRTERSSPPQIQENGKFSQYCLWCLESPWWCFLLFFTKRVIGHQSPSTCAQRSPSDALNEQRSFTLVSLFMPLLLGEPPEGKGCVWVSLCLPLLRQELSRCLRCDVKWFVRDTKSWQSSSRKCGHSGGILNRAITFPSATDLWSCLFFHHEYFKPVKKYKED